MTKETLRKSIQSPANLLALGGLGIVLAYAFVTRAIDTGSLGQYALALLFIGLAISMIVRAIRFIRK